MTRLKDENEELKQVIRNLRISNQSLSNKPEQAELRLLRVYDRALKLMQQRFPVFVPTWQTVIAHVEKEMKLVDSGLAPPPARITRPASQRPNSPPQDTKLLGRSKRDDTDGPTQ
jgi:hypothetical protein